MKQARINMIRHPRSAKRVSKGGDRRPLIKAGFAAQS